MTFSESRIFLVIYVNFNKLLKFIIKFYFQNIKRINALALYKGCRKR